VKAALDKRPDQVAAMFDGVARRYDLTNTVLTAGLDHRWRTHTCEVLELKGGERVLDLAAGTGVSTVQLRRSGAYAVACDFSLGMLRAGKASQSRRHVPFVAGDALHLPFADAAFDAATISFGLRNFADVPAALQELARVVRTGGRLVICEFSRRSRRSARSTSATSNGCCTASRAASRPTPLRTSISPNRSRRGRRRTSLLAPSPGRAGTRCATGI
jgi:demethylmenaquinone methyltransferase/2-methoxy-6-polyprenyl-1,4-benzoquinol methylase